MELREGGGDYETPHFKFRRNETRIILKDLDKCAYPEAVLCNAFARCIEEAKKRAGGSIYKLGISIDSEKLDLPIDVPFREPWINTPAVILHEFQRVAQSKRASVLYSAPITVAISTIGKRDGGKRLKGEVIHNVNQGHLLVIENTDAYCLFRALEATRLHKLIGKPGGLTPMQFSRMMAPANQRRQTTGTSLFRFAKKLMTDCKVQFDLPSYSTEEYAQLVQDYYDRTYPGMFRVVVFSSVGSYRPCFKGMPEKYIFDVCVYYDQAAKHYHGIRCINRLFGSSYYCIDCERPYDRASKHSYKCVRKCNQCGTMGPERPCLPDGHPTTDCMLCGKTFDNQACFDRHTGARCDRFKRCRDCGEYYDMENIRRFSESGKHECGYKFCKMCNIYHKKGRECFIEPLAKPEMKDARFCFFDIESIQDKRTNDTKRYRYLHECNAVHATIVCTHCISNGNWKNDNWTYCNICGPERQKLWVETETADPLQGFLNFLFYELNKDYPTYVLGHYAGRYDLHAVNSAIYKLGGLCPNVIRSGHRIYQMIVSKPGIITETIFKDSYCLVPIALSKFVGAFGLKGQVEDKPFFPYLYNRRCNYDRRLPHLPPKETYSPEHMKPDARDKFDEWYTKNYNTPFYLPDALREYVANDVKLLTYGMLKFREEWLQLCGEDIIQNCVTISSACMRNFRMNHLKKKTLVLTPHGGYERQDRQSYSGLMYLKWMAHKTGLPIRTCESDGGEYRHYYKDDIGRQRHFKLDGYVAPRNGGRPIAIEMDGCFFHGHLEHMPKDTMCANGKTAEMNHKETEARRKILGEAGFDVISIYECEAQAELQNSKEMQQFYEEMLDDGPIDPRAAFAGGRTGPSQLYAEACALFEILYLDIVSLYPFINFDGEYPTGRPTVRVIQQDVDWRRKADNPYKGLLKVIVVAPQSLKLPVLPIKMDDRLLFSTCRTCSKGYRKKSTFVSGYKCEHTEEQRQFVTTVTHNELNKALEKGYRVKRLIRVWEWPASQWSTELFKSYVRQWMKIKVESSELPEWVKTDADKEKFAKENMDLYGIDVKAEDCIPNPARRQIAKLCLNSFWGRFAIRSNLSKTLITDKPHEFFDLVSDPTKDILAIDMVTDTIAHITYNVKNEFVEEIKTSNIFVAIWTTSQARLRLYSYMEQIANTPDCQLLYTDTDSCILKCPRGKCPVPQGDVLGSMKNEYPKHEILEYVSGGSKQYALKLQEKKDPSKIEFCIKMRGITQDVEAAKELHYDAVKEQVLDYANARTIFVNVQRFELSKKGDIHTTLGMKRYRPVNQKSIIVPEDLSCIPFGYNPARP